VVKVIDEDLGIDVSVKVTRIDYPDLMEPSRLVIQLSNRMRDLVDLLANVYETQQQQVAALIDGSQVISGNLPAAVMQTNLATALAASTATLDTLPDGVTYQRTKSVAIDANGMVILDQVVAGTYGLVLTTDISAGHIKLDSVADGTTYKLVLATQISAGKINLTNACTYAAGYDPSGKRRVFTATPTTPYDIGDLWLDASVVKRCTTARASGAYNAADWTATTLDAIGEGTTYGRVKNTQITAGEIVLSSADVQVDKNGVVTGTAGGTRVELASTGLRGYNGAVLQFEASATDGKLSAGAGAVLLGATGIVIKGDVSPNALQLSYGSYDAWIYMHSDGHLTFQCEHDITFAPTGGYVFMSCFLCPTAGGWESLGTSTLYWLDTYTQILGMKETTTPSAVAGFGKLYTKSDNCLYFQDGDGVEHKVGFV